MEHGLATFQRFVLISMTPDLEPNMKENRKPMSMEKPQILLRRSSAIYSFVFNLQQPPHIAKDRRKERRKSWVHIRCKT